MDDHDQRFKTLLREFLPEFFELFFPEWAARFDFSSTEWLEQEAFLDPPGGESAFSTWWRRCQPACRFPIPAGARRITPWWQSTSRSSPRSAQPTSDHACSGTTNSYEGGMEFRCSPCACFSVSASMASAGMCTRSGCGITRYCDSSMRISGCPHSMA